ncbi:hypothetical protein MTR67_031291, partial [Solanum verrucosum]
YSTSLVGITDQLDDLPFGVLHRCLAPSFSIVVLLVIGRHEGTDGFMVYYDASRIGLGKANVVADALSRLSMGSVAHVGEKKKELVQYVHRLSRLVVQLVDSTKGGVMVHNGSKSSLVADVKAKKGVDPILVNLKEVVLKKSIEAFSQGGDGVLRYQGRLCVLIVHVLREQILSEAQSLWYSIYP